MTEVIRQDVLMTVWEQAKSQRESQHGIGTARLEN